MSCTQLGKCILYILGIALPAFGAERRTSAADCRFSSNPDEFLNRAARIRGDAYARTIRVSAAAPAASDGVVPERNFIDQEIFGRLAKHGIPSAPMASDEEFLRRIYLDLTGRIPAPGDVRAFLAASGTDKRDAVIDRLLASAEFTDRWTMWMGDLLQNTATLANASVQRNPQGRNAFHAYIREAVSKDRSLGTIATEVISGKGNNFDASSGAANFALGASTAMGPIQDTYDTMLTRSATTFLGLGIYDCLLCHSGRARVNQLSLWGTRQTRLEAWGMAAFFSRMAFIPSQPNRSFLVTDNVSGGYDLATDSGNRPNRSPIGAIVAVTPSYRETGAAPSSGDWRSAFAENLVRDPMFARNLANRLWKQMFSLALVDPVDSLDPDRLDPSKPPAAPWELQATHPELLEKLAAELARQEFHLRSFLRLLAQSSAYQLSSRFEGQWKEEYVALFARHIPRRMEGEEVHDAVAKPTGLPGDYAIQNSSDRVNWAMQLPDPVEPAGDRLAANLMNVFLRGDRDLQERSQSGSIQQQLSLMNDAFVLDRVRTASSPTLRALAAITGNDALVDEVYLTFLSRHPSAAERATSTAFLSRAADRAAAVEDLAWMCINKVEFLFSY